MPNSMYHVRPSRLVQTIDEYIFMYYIIVTMIMAMVDNKLIDEEPPQSRFNKFCLHTATHTNQ